MIAWNPPFLRGEPTAPAEAGFYGGRNFEVIRRFVTEVRGRLRPGGYIYTILSAEIAIEQIEQLFRQESFTVSRVLSERWGLGETMVILCAR